jgi:hypothetical protein
MYTVVQQVHLNFLLVCLLSFRDPILLSVCMLHLLIKVFLSKLVVQGLTAVVYLCSVVLQGVVALQELVAPPPQVGVDLQGVAGSKGVLSQAFLAILLSLVCQMFLGLEGVLGCMHLLPLCSLHLHPSLCQSWN